MLWTIIFGAVLALSIAGMAWIVVRKLPGLVLLDVESIAREREKQVKYQLVRGRAERLAGAIAARLRKRLRPLKRALLVFARRLYDAVLALERKYRAGGKATDVAARLERLTREAEELVQKGELREAERRYIEIISLNPKYAKAYEELGRLYVRGKQWAEAEEAFRYVLRIDPDDASAHANLGELEVARGDLQSALLYFKAAVRIKPANPKYLDFLLDAAIAAGDRDLVRETFARLKDVNPENQKLPLFEQRIRQM